MWSLLKLCGGRGVGGRGEMELHIMFSENYAENNADDVTATVSLLDPTEPTDPRNI